MARVVVKSSQIVPLLKSPSVELRSYAPEGSKARSTVSAKLLKDEMFSSPSAKYVYRQRFGRAINMAVIERALISAHCGNMRMITDLSRETIETDPHLGAVLNKRFGSVSSLPYEVRPASGFGVDKDKALFYAAVVREQLSNLKHFRRTLRQIAWALFDGRAALECLWMPVIGPSGNGYGKVRIALNGLGWIHPRRLSFGPDRELRVQDEKIGMYGDFALTGIALDDFPAGKFVTWTPQLFGDYPEREGLAIRCMYWSFFKRYGQRDRMILMELFGKPWRIIRVPQDSTANSDDLIAADEAVDGLGGSYTARMARGTELDVVQPQRTAGQVHARVIEDVDKQISKLVLGQTGTTDGVPAGLNSNQASVMQDEQLGILISDAAEISEVVESQITDQMIALNFGPMELPHAPDFVLRSDLPVDRNQELERIQLALNAGLWLSMSEAYEISGFRVPEVDEPIVRMDQPPTPPLAPGPPAARPVIVWPDGKSPPAGEQQPATPQASVGEGGREDTGITVGSADQASVMTVNEARAGQGLPPLKLPSGAPDPDGDLTIAEFNSKRSPKNGKTMESASAPERIVEEVSMMIRRSGGRWCVYSDDGSKSFGCYDSKAKAEARLKQIEAFKHMASKSMGVSTIDLLLANAAHGEAMLLEAERFVMEYSAEFCDSEGVLLARQPSTVNGSLEDIIEKGTPEIDRAVQKLADQFVEAVSDKTNVTSIYEAADDTRDRLDLRPFARALERRMLHSLALGGLDAWFDEEGETVSIPTFAADVEPRFAKMRFEEAMRYFRGKNVVTRAQFDRLSAVAKQRAFTVAALTSDQMLATVHAELVRQIGQGADIREFGKFFVERLKSAGVIKGGGLNKAEAAYVQNVFRTNTLGAYNAGRHARMSDPEVMKARPYWQIRTVHDSRRRAAHGRADNLVLRADDPFWSRAYPPFGFECRCRIVSLSEKQASGAVIVTGSTINYLPDPGFTSGVGHLMAMQFGGKLLASLMPSDVREPAEVVKVARAVQTLIFDKAVFETREDALNWTKNHGFKSSTSRETGSTWRVRQRPPNDFKKDTLRPKEIAKGVSILDGELNG